jgi:hypothetical protein
MNTFLGEEHMQRLKAAAYSNVFICKPVATKEMYDGVQTVGPKTPNVMEEITSSMDS